MRWEGSDHRRFARSRSRLPGMPVPGRVILGAVAIACIALALLLNPPQQVLNPPKAAPEARPTTVSAAIVSIPTPVPATPAPSVAASMPAAVPGPSGSSGTRTHEVAQGDTLSSIAKKYYGDASKWGKIMDANKDVLKSPEGLQLGQKLKIPD